MRHEPDDGIEWALLARYLAGEATGMERLRVEEWIASDPAHEEEMATLRRIWGQAAALPAPARIDAMWRAVARDMHAPQVTLARPTARDRARPPRRSREPVRLRRALGAIAASLVLGAVGVGAWSALGSGSEAATGTSPVQRYETARAHTSRFQLADGTRVLLGPESRLTVASLDGGGARELELVGEAVFEVVHDESRPFLVRAGHAVTEDLGTKFAIRAYPDDRDVHVVVVEGRVALRAHRAPAHSGTILERGQMGKLDIGGRIQVDAAVDTRARLGWADGRIVFDQTPLRAVVTELERWYDVDLQITDSTIAAQRITLDMPAASLPEVLDAIAVPLNLRYEKTRDAIRLHR